MWYKSNPHGSPTLVSTVDCDKNGTASLTVKADGEQYYAQFSNTGVFWVTSQKARAGYKPKFAKNETVYNPCQRDAVTMDFTSDYDEPPYSELIEEDDIYVEANGTTEKLAFDNNFVYKFNKLSIINVNFTDERSYYRVIKLKDGSKYTSPKQTVTPSEDVGEQFITDYYITGFEGLCIGDKAPTAEDLTVYSDKYSISSVSWASGVDPQGYIISPTPSCGIILQAVDGYQFKFDEYKELKGYVGDRLNTVYTSIPGHTTPTLLVSYAYDNHFYLTEPKDSAVLKEDSFTIEQYGDADIQLEPIHDCPKQHTEKHTITSMEIFAESPLPEGLTMDENGHITGTVKSSPEDFDGSVRSIVLFNYSDGTQSSRDLYITVVEHTHEYISTIDKNGDTHVNCKKVEFCGCEEIVIKGSAEVHHFGRWTDCKDGTHKRTCTDKDCGLSEVQPHTWDEGKATKEATKNSDGVFTYTCTVCGAVKTEALKYESKDDSSSKPDSNPDDSGKPAGKKVLLGDVTQDGVIDIDDAVTIISHINGINPLTDVQMKIGNVEGDESEIDIADAVAIIGHINGVKAIEGYVEI